MWLAALGFVPHRGASRPTDGGDDRQEAWGLGPPHGCADVTASLDVYQFRRVDLTWLFPEVQLGDLLDEV